MCSLFNNVIIFGTRTFPFSRRLQRKSGPCHAPAAASLVAWAPGGEDCCHPLQLPCTDRDAPGHCVFGHCVFGHCLSRAGEQAEDPQQCPRVPAASRCMFLGEGFGAGMGTFTPCLFTATCNRLGDAAGVSKGYKLLNNGDKL